MRLIDADELKKQVKELLDLAVKRVNDTPNNSPCYRMYVEQENERARLIDLIDNAPTVERPQGEWILVKVNLKFIYKCSECGRTIKLTHNETLLDYPFCHCGADMRGKEE